MPPAVYTGVRIKILSLLMVLRSCVFMMLSTFCLR